MMYMYFGGFMIKVSATKLRNNLFKYLDKINDGETIIIQRNKQDIAHLIPTRQTDWRDNMKVQLKLQVAPEKFIEPVEDVWEGTFEKKALSF